MSLDSVLTLNGTSYTAAQRAALTLSLNEFTRFLEGGYDSLSFSEFGGTAYSTWGNGQTVALDINQGSGLVRYFSGEITDIQSQPSAFGWTHGYTCLGLKYLADRIPVTAVDGTGSAVYNRNPNGDAYYIASDAGLSVGTIISRILRITATATALNAIGVGAYTSLSPPTLPSGTTADLALLTVVPRSVVIFSGESILNQIDQFLCKWTPKFFQEVVPSTGEIRYRDTTSTTVFVPHTFTLASDAGPADPIGWPSVRRSTERCATRLVMRGGPDCAIALLTLGDGTLAEVFTSGQKSSWNLTYFTKPQGATDSGAITAMTSTSSTLDPSGATVFWNTNFWSVNQGVITMTSIVNTGINVSESRIINANTACVAGGTGTVSWDSGWPVTNTNFTKYQIVASASGGLNDVWRRYTPREPATGNTGLNTWIGSHLVVRSPFVLKWANSTTMLGEYYATAFIFGPHGESIPLGLQVSPSDGTYLFNQPTVTVFGNISNLNSGSPTTVADGIPSDVEILAIYSRGPLTVTANAEPSGPVYTGTAYTVNGMQVTKYMDCPNWTWSQDTLSMRDLAKAHLETLQDAQIDIQFDWYVANGVIPSIDPFAFNYGVNVAINGHTSPWSAINAPVRSVRLKWISGAGPGMTHGISIAGSTRRRAFSGDDLYIHPEFKSGSVLSNVVTGGGFYMPTSALGMMMNGGMSQQGQGSAPGGMMTGTGGGEGNYQQFNANVLERLQARQQRMMQGAGGGDDGSGEMDFGDGGPVGRPSRTKGAKARSVKDLKKLMGERDPEKRAEAMEAAQDERQTAEMNAKERNLAGTSERAKARKQEKQDIDARNQINKEDAPKRRALAKKEMSQLTKNRQAAHDTQRAKDMAGINKRAEQRKWEGDRLRAKARMAMQAKQSREAKPPIDTGGGE